MYTIKLDERDFGCLLGLMADSKYFDIYKPSNKDEECKENKELNIIDLLTYANAYAIQFSGHIGELIGDSTKIKEPNFNPYGHENFNYDSLKEEIEKIIKSTHGK